MPERVCFRYHLFFRRLKEEGGRNLGSQTCRCSSNVLDVYVLCIDWKKAQGHSSENTGFLESVIPLP